MADLIGSDVGTLKMYRWTGETTTLNASFSVSSVDTLNRGVDWDGTDLKWAGSQAGKGYHSTGFALTIQASYSTGAGSNTRGFTWDGSNAMDFERATDKWRQRSGFSASVTASFLKGNQPLGGTWVVADTDLLTCDNVDDKHRQHSGFTATINASFSTSGNAYTGTAENTSGEFIDSSTAGVDKVNKRDVFTSTITKSWSPAEGTSRIDVAWDGRFAAAPGLDFLPLFERRERTYLRM